MDPTELHIPRGGAESPADTLDGVRGLVLSLSHAARTRGCPQGGPDWPRISGLGHPDETGQAWCLRGPRWADRAVRVSESSPKLESKSIYFRSSTTWSKGSLVVRYENRSGLHG